MKKILIAVVFLAGINVFARQNANDETVAVIKQNLATSKENLKHYEWIETITVFMKGEEKSKKQNRCYYDATGKLTKVATGGGSEPADKKRGIRGKVIENKTDEMEDYIKACIEKVQAYLPPDPAKIQQIYGAGKAVVHILEPNNKFKLDFPGYLQEGDILGIGVDKANKQLLSLSVNSYLQKAEDKVNFGVKYSPLPDGTQYAAQTTLEAPAKNLKIILENSGYKKSN